MTANHLALNASIVQVSPLRYTPAGIPAVNLVLQHSSELLEAGLSRQVSLSLKAVAFGVLAEQLATAPLGEVLQFSGFLSNARAHKGIVFHIQVLQAMLA